MPPERLVSAFYLNELLLKLFARHDSHPDVFALYARTIESLQRDANPMRALRLFEKRLLDAIGYGLALQHEFASGQPVDPRAAYHYRLEQGAVRVQGVAASGTVFSGELLLALAREDLDHPATCAAARPLLRAALDRCLEGRELRTRQVMRALRRK